MILFCYGLFLFFFLKLSKVEIRRIYIYFLVVVKILIGKDDVES